MKALIAAKAAVSLANDNGFSPLYCACQNGHTDVAADLLAANAEIEQANTNNATPMQQWQPQVRHRRGALRVRDG